MASEDVPAFAQNLTADGTAAGLLPVTDSSGFYPGAYAWLASDTLNQFCQITEVPDATHVAVRFLPDPGAALGSVSYAPSYGRSSCAAFTLALHSRLSMYAQLVRIIQPQFSKRTLA